MATRTLEDLLNGLTKEGELYEKLEGGKLRCFSCGHRCLIPEGRAGVCRVRFNRGGTLYVPSGYVGALQDDPIEKKPFFHSLPGVRILSFGMLGCDFHCGYCFPPGTRVPTSRGLLPIENIVRSRMPVAVYTHTGKRRKITNYFSRPCRGAMIRIKPAFLPPLECTPEHPLWTRLRPDRYPGDSPRYLPAEKLTTDHCLAVPKDYEFSEDVLLECEHHLRAFAGTYRVKRKIPAEVLERILRMSSEGKSSKIIALEVAKSASHVRHMRAKIRRGVWDIENLGAVNAKLIHENGHIRFSKEHAPGIPARVPLDSEFSELLGYYCAEGSVSMSRDRVRSASLDFSFGKQEREKVERVISLVWKIFRVRCRLVERETTLAASTGKTSLALLFKGLCGSRGLEKRVPEALFRAKREVIESFLNAYVAGDGYRAPDGQSRISTISEELFWGIAWLVQKLGYLPQCHRYPSVSERKLLGRDIKQSPWTYLVRWYEFPKRQRHVWDDERFRYVLIEKIEGFAYEGPVYNLETEEDHTYLANFVTVHNCQNWVTSQALRDPVAVSKPARIKGDDLVDLAVERDCQAVASTYNEPLITSEWAVEIFREAKRRGLSTAYISNGNGTPEVLDYIRPWVDLYKVDLKSFEDRHYRELGGALENVLQTIRGLYERGFWLELLTLLIPGFNDDPEELKRLTGFVASVSPDIPWHVTAFHKDYKMTDPENTSPEDLTKAAEIGKKAGLRYVYAGNLPGMVGDWENTYCPDCHELLIERYGFQILRDRLTAAGGRCFKCGNGIPGFWKQTNSKRNSENRIEPLI